MRIVCSPHFNSLCSRPSIDDYIVEAASTGNIAVKIKVRYPIPEPTTEIQPPSPSYGVRVTVTSNMDATNPVPVFDDDFFRSPSNSSSSETVGGSFSTTILTLTSPTLPPEGVDEEYRASGETAPPEEDPEGHIFAESRNTTVHVFNSQSNNKQKKKCSEGKTTTFELEVSERSERALRKTRAMQHPVLS